LKWLGIGSAMPMAAAASMAGIPAYLPKPEPKQAFRFTCECQRDLVAPVPDEEGTTLLHCDCGQSWLLRWMTDHFKVTRYGR